MTGETTTEHPATGALAEADGPAEPQLAAARESEALVLDAPTPEAPMSEAPSPDAPAPEAPASDAAPRPEAAPEAPAGEPAPASPASATPDTGPTPPAPPVPPLPQPPAQSEPPKPGAVTPGLKPAPKWIDAPPLTPWRRLMLHLHRAWFDRAGNRLDRAATATETPLRDLDTVGPNRAQGHDYRPTPRRLVAWALDCLPDPVEDTTFLDIGSGRGRVLFEAARRPFQRIVGIEFARELHEDAELNLRHWPRSLMRCREIDLILGDAPETPLPEGNLVVWMFDPFGERLVTRMAARLAEHARTARVSLVLVDPRNPMAFRESPAFRPIEPPAAIRRRIALLSPYAVRIFTVRSN